jgi:hypothetical protein
MADQIVPQGGAGSPTRRGEPRSSAAQGEQGRQGTPHGAQDGVPELIENVAVDRQSRRYNAHTLRRSGDLSTPVRVGDVSGPVRAELSAPVRTDVVGGAGRGDVVSPPADHEIEAAMAKLLAPEATNRPSAPSDSTALYRKRTNPALPAVSPDATARPPPGSEPSHPDAVPDAPLDVELSAPNPDAADLPAVMLDGPAPTGLRRPLALPRPPVRLILSIIAVALAVVGLWLVRLAF